MTKPHVVVFYGGRSTEHEVACRGASFIFKNLDRSLYDVSALGITHDGHWYLQDNDDLKNVTDPAFPIHKINHIDASIDALLRELNKKSKVTQESLVVFPILHGSFGEDGTLQGLLEMAEVAYVGPSALASAICMDKEVAKNLVRAAGIDVGPFVAIRHENWHAQEKAIISDIESEWGYPVFVKPANAGSAVGVNKARNADALLKAVEEAYRYDDKILIEKAMDGREIEYAVMGGYEAKVSTPGEVTFGGDFFNYKEKYTSASTQEFLVPAPIDSATNERGIELTKRVYRAVQLHGLSRIDWFLDRKTNVFYFNEVNTIPGFTAMSSFPVLWKHDGIGSTEVLTELVSLGLKRRQQKHRLARVFIND